MSQPLPSAPWRAVVAGALAVAGGLAWTASQAPYGIAPATFLVVAAWLGALHAVAGRGVRASAAVGLVLGTTAGLLTLTWLALPATWLAVVLLAVVQGVWVALASVAVRRWTGHGIVVLVGPVAWTAMEVARARVPLGGFGWADLASGHAGGSFLLGTVRVVGADGLTLLTALGGALLFALWRTAATAITDPARPSGPAGGVAVLDAARPPLLGLVGIGAAGLLVTIGAPAVVGTIDVLLAQGNDGTNAARGAAEDLRIATALADVTVAAVEADGVPDLVLWPEYALDRDPFLPAGADLAEQVARVHAVAATPLLAGVRVSTPTPATFANELVVIEADGSRGASYRKQQVVPFGEYVPLRSVLGGFPPLAAGVPSDAVPGTGPAVVRVAGVDVALAICFETLFGPIVRDAVRTSDAGFVIAATNDASYGVSAASEQHLAQSVLRAVETGRTVLHASLNGVSAVIAPDGAVVERTELFDVTTLRAEVPLVTGSTPAVHVAPVLSALLLGAGSLLLLATVGLELRDRRRDVEEVAA